MRRFPILVTLALAVPGIALCDALAKPFREVVPAKAGGAVVLENLAGKLDVVPGHGPDVVLTGTVHADAGARAESQRLLDAVTVDVRSGGGSTTLHVTYPVDSSPFRYPGEEREPSFWSSSSSSVDYQGRRVKVSEGGGSGPMLYADLTLELPGGIAVSVVNHLGRVTARGVGGALDVRTSSADVSVENVAGRVSVKTGSGDVRTDRCQGLEVATGSGDVAAAGVRGEVSIHTGSGDVTVSRSEAGRVAIQTGSGEVDLDGVVGSLELHTGSGDIEGRALTQVEQLKVGTGSGQVRLALDAPRGVGGSIETASGDVELAFASTPAMSLSVSTSSGGLDVDRLPGLQVTRRTERRLEAEVKGGGPAFRIRTASGDVTVR